MQPPAPRGPPPGGLSRPRPGHGTALCPARTAGRHYGSRADHQVRDPLQARASGQPPRCRSGYGTTAAMTAPILAPIHMTTTYEIQGWIPPIHLLVFPRSRTAPADCLLWPPAPHLGDDVYVGARERGPGCVAALHVCQDSVHWGGQIRHCRTRQATSRSPFWTAKILSLGMFL